jgi:polyadenylate-binding protein
MAAMNGVTLGSKPIVVRLHEPKQFRQEKLAQRFQGNGHPRSASGATSPTPSEGGESMYGGYNSPRHISSPLASPGNGHFQERPARRASGSYYQAALNGNLNVPLTYDALNALSANVRREVLSGELSRRVRALETVPNGEVDVIVDSLINLSLGEVVQSLSDNGHLAEHVGATLRALHGTPEEHEHEQSPAADGSSLAPGTVTAPEHPSTPVSLNTSSATPPRTASPAGSLPVQAPERDRMAAAVARWAPGPQEAELTELLMGLPKRDRALCLFNENKLREKIAEARVILDADDDEDPPPSASATSTVPVTPATPVAKAVQPQQPAPATPELSRAPSAAASPMPATPSSPADAEGGDTLTLESLARLSAAEIVRTINSGGASGVSLPKADPAVVSQTDAFVDGLSEKPIQQQKQALGDKL